MRIKFNDKIYRLKEVESGVDSLMKLVEEPKYKDGDFVYEDGRIMIVKSYPNMYHANAYPGHRPIVFYNDWYLVDFSSPTFRHATEEEKQILTDAMRKDGKRWNAERLCVEDIPSYKKGDFLVKEYNNGAQYIFILDYIDDNGTIYYHCYHSNKYDTTRVVDDYGIGMVGDSYHKCLRYATDREKELLIAELYKVGKRWNAEKKCVEDIPVRKFKEGDKVKIKDGISNKTHERVSPGFTSTMDKFIGKKLTVKEYRGGFAVISEDYCGYYFNEDWLEPWSDEPKKGDLAIFWDDNKDHAIIRIYNIKGYSHHSDSYGHLWENAIKFESKEQFEKVLRGEI